MAKTIKKFLKSFTLIELIIVIAIIAVLGVAAFLVLTQWMSKGRDGSRIKDLVQIDKGLNIYYSQFGEYPMPSYNVMSIYASGIDNVLSYQGGFGPENATQTNLIGKLKDPKDNKYYSYVRDYKGNRYAISGFLEGQQYSYVKNQVKADLEKKYIKVYGNDLGTITTFSGDLLQDLKTSTFTGLDLINTNSSYIIHIDNTNKLQGSGINLRGLILLNSTDFNQLQNNILLDTSLAGYWDMQTTINSGGVEYLKDFSKLGNNGLMYNYDLQDGKVGKAGSFNGVSTYLYLGNLYQNYASDWTVSAWIKPTKANNIMSILGIKDGGPSTHVFQLSGSKVSFLHYNSTWLTEYAKSNLIDNIWYHVSWVNHGNIGKMDVYVNGEIDGEKLNSRFSTGKRYVDVVGKAWSGKFFTGSIDELILFNRALSSLEIQNYYNLSK